MGISICVHLVGGFMVGVEYIWGQKMLLIDVGIVRFTLEYIGPEDIEHD